MNRENAPTHYHKGITSVLFSRPVAIPPFHIYPPTYPQLTVSNRNQPKTYILAGTTTNKTNRPLILPPQATLKGGSLSH